MKAGQIRIRIEVDEYFDRSCKDWDPELGAETAAKLKDGSYEVFETLVDQLHCDAPECPHHEQIGALCGTVTAGGWTTGEDKADYTLREVLEGISADDHEHLREIVLGILSEADWSPPSFAGAELLPEDRAAIDELI